MNRYIQDGDYYIIIETDTDREFHIFNNYEDAVMYCNKNLIDIKQIKIWKNYFTD